MGFIDEIKLKSKVLKRDIMAIYLACKRPEIPWHVKLLAVIIIGYALSPIDLIPDFVPILGYLDDLLLLPLGLGLMIKLIPGEVMEECRQEASVKYHGKKVDNWIAGAVILILWMAVILFVISKIAA